MRRCVLIAALLPTALGVLASPAPAAPTWGQIAPLSSSALDADLATDAQGNTVVVWMQSVFEGGSSDTRVYAAFRSPGGAFSAPQQLSASGQDASSPQVAMDAAGNAVAIWQREDGTSLVCCDRVQAAVRSAGGAFGAAQTLSAGDASDPQVAVGNGQAVAVWDGPSAIETATASLPNGFGATAAISSSSGLTPRVALDASGNALAVWMQFVSGVGRIHSAFQPASGGFAAPQVVPTAPLVAGALVSPGSTSSPEVAFDPAGRAIVVYEGSDGYSPAIPCCTRAIAAVRSSGAGGTWATPVYLSSTRKSAGDAEVLATAGETIAIWRESASETATGGSGSGYVLRAAARPTGAATAFGAPQDVTGAVEEITTPQLFTGQNGAINAVWRQWDRVETAYRPASGPFDPARTVFTAPDRFYLGQVYAVGTSTCDGLIAWKYEGLQLAVGDTDGNPALSADVPAAGQAGTAVAMAASATDGCSVPTVSWSFGDGASGTGNAVSHAYAAAGTYSVTATARDAAGNTATATRTVVVSKVDKTIVVVKDATAPVISAFGVSRATFRVGKKATAVIAARRRTAIGATFTFGVSEAGAATIAIQRKVKRHWKPAGTLRRSAVAGRNKVAFTGRVGKSPLAAGSYRATLKVADPAGNVSLPKRVTFRIVKR